MTTRWRSGAGLISLLLVSGTARDVSAAALPPISIPGGQITVSQRGAATLLTFHTHRGTQAIRLPNDPGVSAGTLEHAERLATVSGKILLLATTYSSQTGIGGPQARCAAGEESFVRAIRLGPRPTQTARLTTMSCWTSVELAGPRWDAAKRRIVFEGAEEMYVVSPAGKLNLFGAK